MRFPRQILLPVAVQDLRARAGSLSFDEIMSLISSHEQLRAIALVKVLKARRLEEENESLHLDNRRLRAVGRGT